MDAFTTALSALVGLGAGAWVFDTMRRRQVPPPLPNLGDNLQTMSLLPARNVWRKNVPGSSETP